MSIENRPNASEEKQLHPGIVPVDDGGERPLPKARPIEDINTGEIPSIVPETLYQGFENLPPTDQEKAAFDQARASRRDLSAPTEEIEKKPNSKKKLFAVIGGAATAAVAATALFLMPKGENNHDDNKPTPTQPVATASASPTLGFGQMPVAEGTPTQKKEQINPADLYKGLTDAEIIEKLKIPAGLSNQDYAARVVQLYSDWGNTGATPSWADKWDPHLSPEEYATPLVDHWSNIYATVLFGPDYAKNTDIAQHVKFTHDRMLTSVVTYLGTYDPNHYNPANIEPWKTTLTLEKVVDSGSTLGNGRAITYKTIETNNGTLNKVGSNPRNNYEVTWKDTTSIVNGAEYISTLTTDK